MIALFKAHLEEHTVTIRIIYSKKMVHNIFFSFVDMQLVNALSDDSDEGNEGEIND